MLCYYKYIHVLGYVKATFRGKVFNEVALFMQ